MKRDKKVGLRPTDQILKTNVEWKPDGTISGRVTFLRTEGKRTFFDYFDFTATPVCAKR